MGAASRVHRLATAAHLEVGDSAAAYESVRQSFRLYRALENDLSMQSGLLRVSVLIGINAVVRDGLAANRWNEPELRKLADDYAAIDWLADWRSALSGERTFINLNFDLLETESNQATAQKVHLFSSMTWCATEPVDPVLYPAIVAIYPRGWVFLSRVKINEYFDRQVATIDRSRQSGRPLEKPSPDDELLVLQRGGFLQKIPY